MFLLRGQKATTKSLRDNDCAELLGEFSVAICLKPLVILVMPSNRSAGREGSQGIMKARKEANKETRKQGGRKEGTKETKRRGLKGRKGEEKQKTLKTWHGERGGGPERENWREEGANNDQTMGHKCLKI